MTFLEFEGYTHFLGAPFFYIRVPFHCAPASLASISDTARLGF